MKEGRKEVNELEELEEVKKEEETLGGARRQQPKDDQGRTCLSIAGNCSEHAH